MTTEPHKAPPCPHCGSTEPHFVPPSMGEEGFYACESVSTDTTKRAEHTPVDLVVLGLVANEYQKQIKLGEAHVVRLAAAEIKYLRNLRDAFVPALEMVKRCHETHQMYDKLDIHVIDQALALARQEVE